MKRCNILFYLFLIVLQSCNSQDKKQKEELMQSVETEIDQIADRHLENPVDADTIEVGVVEKTPEAWREILEPAEYAILREGGTEPAFLNAYYDNEREGIYSCGACGLPLYSSLTKFKSGTGWPSFWAPIDSKLVERRPDDRFGMIRTEVICAQCGSHLGHIFDNNSVPSGERHCLNSLALDFQPKDL